MKAKAVLLGAPGRVYKSEERASQGGPLGYCRMTVS